MHPECEATEGRVIQEPTNPELAALRQAQDLTRPEHRRSLPSMALRHAVRPEHRRSLPSMALRHTVRPEHKKASRYDWLCARKLMKQLWHHCFLVFAFFFDDLWNEIFF